MGLPGGLPDIGARSQRSPANTESAGQLRFRQPRSTVFPRTFPQCPRLSDEIPRIHSRSPAARIPSTKHSVTGPQSPNFRNSSRTMSRVCQLFCLDLSATRRSLRRRLLTRRWLEGASHHPTAFRLPMTQTAATVGVPVAERALTRSLDTLASHLFTPGSGRSLVRLHEVDIGTGRPDAIYLVVSSAALRARLRADLRLPTIAHARVLESLLTGASSAYCQQHVNQITNSLNDLGWLTNRRSVRALRMTISSSFLVEAKVSNWRRGILQLARARWASHQAALLMPRETHHRVRKITLAHNSLGLLVEHQDRIDWETRSPTLRLCWTADLWLTELAIRQIAAGNDYSSSSATN